MYAIIQSGGKQYRVAEGDLVRVERLAGEVGDVVSFNDVLVLSNDEGLKLGTPTLSDARVVGRITDQGKGDKVLVFKFKKRKMFRRKRGHRQLFTGVKIDKIEFGALGPLPQPEKKVEKVEKPAAEPPKKKEAKPAAEKKKTAAVKEPKPKKPAVKEAKAKKPAAKKAKASAPKKAKASAKSTKKKK